MTFSGHDDSTINIVLGLLLLLLTAGLAESDGSLLPGLLSLGHCHTDSPGQGSASYPFTCHLYKVWVYAPIFVPYRISVHAAGSRP